MPPPVKVEPPRMRVDFNRYAVFRAGLQDLVDIDLVSRVPQQLASGHVADDGGVRVRCPSRSLRLLLPVQFEPSVNARNDEIEVFKDIVRIIERAVREYIGFDPFQDAESLPPSCSAGRPHGAVRAISSTVSPPA